MFENTQPKFITMLYYSQFYVLLFFAVHLLVWQYSFQCVKGPADVVPNAVTEFLKEIIYKYCSFLNILPKEKRLIATHCLYVELKNVSVPFLK